MADSIIRLTFKPGIYRRLIAWTEPPKEHHIHEEGGYQNRKAKFRLQMDDAAFSIWLDGEDKDWIIRQLKNKGGGWQRDVVTIFAGRHPAFVGIRPDPPKKPEQRKRRRPPGTLV